MYLVDTIDYQKICCIIKTFEDNILFQKNYHSTWFLKSIANIQKEKYNYGLEVAFVGYSNSGKSSIINALTNQKKLAKISRTPGRTRLINIFSVTSEIRLVDFPGYGYAQVSRSISKKWKEMIFQYLNIQKCLQGLVIITDIRCPIKEIDELVINLAVSLNIPILLLLNKMDKVTRSIQKSKLFSTREKMLNFSNNINVELFSSFKKIGIHKLQFVLNNWFSSDKKLCQ
uniref:Probable GTP-binding protein EngB n=1 Tax=Buchnera aphidicola subsp. Baizongia pistaciae (strain Bp) TaxID=224915 RepID=ENGB_BUCBP|nr:RecName: Full=Probable GTP-binding protein EngB [Buchnera aphidicola str. Bp (Baizongia pistaciae)]